MKLSCEMADDAMKGEKLDTNRMEMADRLAEEVGVLADRCGYTMDDTRRICVPHAATRNRKIRPRITNLNYTKPDTGACERC